MITNETIYQCDFGPETATVQGATPTLPAGWVSAQLIVESVTTEYLGCPLHNTFTVSAGKAPVAPTPMVPAAPESSISQPSLLGA